MFHKSLLKCISNTGAEASFIDSRFDLTLTQSNQKTTNDTSLDTIRTFSLSKLKKKFNSSNEKLGLQLRSKLKKTIMKPQATKVKKSKIKIRQNISNTSIVTFNSSNIMSSTVCSNDTKRNTSYQHTLHAYSLSFSGFYSENSDISDDDSDDDSDVDTDISRSYLEETLQYGKNNFQDSSFSSIESFDMDDRTLTMTGLNRTDDFNPVISSSRYETSICSKCEQVSRAYKHKRRSLGIFLPAQTSSRIVLTECPDVSNIVSDSNYFSSGSEDSGNFEKTLFSSTMISAV